VQNQKKRVVLTIDDGPSEHFLPKCHYLHLHHIPAVFFCIGKHMEAAPDQVTEAIKMGFIIANHSYSHPHFSDISIQQAREEIEKTDILINNLYKAAGMPRPVKWFRFPYGDKGDGRHGKVFGKRWRVDNNRKNDIQDFLKQLEYTQPGFSGISYPFYREAGLLADTDWHWTFDVMEWCLTMKKPDFGIDTPEKVMLRLQDTCPGDCRGLRSRAKRWIGNPDSDEIILLHDQSATTYLFYPIIDKLLQLPLQFVLPPDN
jgi:peptidoglycan/xylan/chitin deacetylase (PgdA/CDA1 family)